MPAKFGTSGLRGLVVELLGDATKRHTLTFAESLLARGLVGLGHEVIIGWDLRQSSPLIAAEVAASVAHAGLAPIAIGEIPTPVLAYHAISLNRPSIMVTGSHIPADRNGIKFYVPTGEITKADEERIARGAASLKVVSLSEFNLQIDEKQRFEAFDRFLARCIASVPAGCLKGKTIGIYEHSSVGREVMHEVLKKSGAETVTLGRSKDFVALDTEDVSAEVQSQLKVWSAAHRLDAIVSADGDADRPLIADESGTLIRGDALGILTCQYLRSEHVATPVTSSSAVERVLSANISRTRVGSPQVIAAMRQAENQGEKTVSGFEANGGFLIGTEHFVGKTALVSLPTRDAFLPILAVLALAASKNAPLSVLVSSLNLPASLATRLENYPTDKSLALLHKLQSDQAARADFTSSLGALIAVDNIDGLRMQFDGGKIVHLRPSGNAPELRIYVEAHTQIEAQRLLQETRTKILPS